jgi:hypothetical protein
MNLKNRLFVSALTALTVCSAVTLSPARQAGAQTPESQISAEWKALGWPLPQSFAPDQIALFKGLNAARGSWSFEAEIDDGAATTSVTGNLEVKGSSQGGMASTWSLLWTWPAENPQHAIVESIIAVPDENQQFGLMLARFGPLKHSEAQLAQKPKVAPTVFTGEWNADQQAVSWTPKELPGTPDDQSAPQEDGPAFTMLITADGKISIQNSQNLPAGQLTSGGATARAGDAPETPELLTGLHHFEQSSDISDPRITRYLPAEATDITLNSGRAGHQAQYRISAEAFDKFLVNVWERYREERAAKPKYWVDYSEEDITRALTGSPVGRYEPKIRETTTTFSFNPLENATSYGGPRRMSAAGATYHFDQKAGMAFHDAGYW